MVCNATFNNFSAITLRSVLLVGGTGIPRENHRPTASHRQYVSHNVVHLALFVRESNSQHQWWQAPYFILIVIMAVIIICVENRRKCRPAANNWQQTTNRQTKSKKGTHGEWFNASENRIIETCIILLVNHLQGTKTIVILYIIIYSSTLYIITIKEKQISR